MNNNEPREKKISLNTYQREMILTWTVKVNVENMV